MVNPDRRPTFLNILRIKMPPGAIASIAHRISGVLLFLVIVPAVYLFDLALSGPAGFERATVVFSHPLACLVVTVMVWAIAHHLFAGIRFLLLDLDLGLSREVARATAWLVNILGILAVLGFLAGTW